jgi:hypothetical protein
MRRARVFGDVFGDPSPRDKEHHRASRKCRSESTVQRNRDGPRASCSAFQKSRGYHASDHRIYRRRTKRRRDKPPYRQTSTSRQHNAGGATRLDIFDVS